MDMKQLHAEYLESCELFGVEKTLEGFHDYVAKVKRDGPHAEPNAKPEGSETLDEKKPEVEEHPKKRRSRVPKRV